MAHKKEDLEKLLKLLTIWANEEGNEWFRERLKELFNTPKVSVKQTSFGNEKTVTEDEINSVGLLIEDIHEHCIRLIMRKQAEEFYSNFALKEIKDVLVRDFIRMEQFRREDNFEDFCLSIFQQIENIVNYLCEFDVDFCNDIILNKDADAYSLWDKQTNRRVYYKLCHLIVDTFKSTEALTSIFSQPLLKWDFKYKMKAVLYYFYFNRKLNNYYEFKNLYDLTNELQQGRNLNHRGGFQTDRQKEMALNVKEAKYQYYLKFLGLLEDITYKLNLKERKFSTLKVA